MKWQSLSYKRKNIGLVSAFLFCLILSYLLSLSKTISLYVDNQNLAKLHSAGQDIDSYANRIKVFSALDSVYASLAVQDYQIELLQSVAQTCRVHKVNVENIVQLPELDERRLDLVQVSGSYSRTLAFVQAFQSTFPGATIVSVNYHREFDRNSRRDQLLLDLYIQKLLPDENS